MIGTKLIEIIDRLDLMSVRDKIAMWNNMASNSAQGQPSPTKPTANSNTSPKPPANNTYSGASNANTASNSSQGVSGGSVPWAVEGGGIVKPSQMKGGSPWNQANTGQSSQPPVKKEEQPKPSPVVNTYKT